MIIAGLLVEISERAKPSMNVLYTCDDNYAWIMAVSMVSLFESNKESDEITVYLLGENISEESQSNLEQIASVYKRSFVLIPTDDVTIDSALVSERWPKSAYMRLFCSKLLPADIEGIVYLDCDTVVIDDISAIYECCFSDAPIRAVLDPVNSRWKENIGLRSGDVYVNAGVLAINLVALRQIDVERKVNEYLGKYSSMITFADQDVLNGIFSNSIVPFDNPRFNLSTMYARFSYEELLRFRAPDCFYSEEAYEFGRSNPAVVHFTTCMLTVRPWFKDSDHPKAYLFDQYLELTPYANHIRDYAKFKGARYRFFALVDFLPWSVQIRLFGLLHSVLKPTAKRLSAKRRQICG